MDVADLNVLMAAMEAPEAAEAMAHDGVLGETPGDPGRGVVLNASEAVAGRVTCFFPMLMPREYPILHDPSKVECNNRAT